MPGKRPRIVVVEDDASLSQAMERILRAGGFTPVAFASAEAALEAASAVTADCLVLDIRLPGMSGLDFYRQLTPATEKPPAVFITAQDEPAMRAEAESVRGNSYLPKPFSGRALLEAVTRALRSQEP